jgi:hypothetical protein
MYIDAAPIETVTAAPSPIRLKRLAGPRLGIASLGGAVVCVILDVIAVVIASSGGYILGTALGALSIALSVAATLAGMVAATLRLGRGWGVAGALLGIAANPYLQLVVLRLVSDLQN